MVKLRTPLTRKDVEKLTIGDWIKINGTIYTARDEAHRKLLKSEELTIKLKNGIIYHCGPLLKKGKIIAAGPTTSARMEAYEAELIKKYKIRTIIGKGGMGKNTLEALSKEGCIYCLAVGGAAVFLAESIKEVKNVYYLDELGKAEAIWELEVKDFPALVTMDCHGNSLHSNLEEKSRKLLAI